LSASSINPNPPLLEQDPFVLFAEYTLCSIPSQRLDVKSVMKMFYVAEIVRVILAFSRHDTHLVAETDEIGAHDEAEDPIITEFLSFIPSFNIRARPRLMSRIIRAYALPFLRKCTILMHVRYGIDFPASLPISTSSEKKETELTRLTHLLRLPDLSTLLKEVMFSPPMTAIIHGWIHHLQLGRDPSSFYSRIIAPSPDDVSSAIRLSHPAIFELVGLPKNFDTLQDEVGKRRCPTTGRPLTDPALCLVCGEIFCSQSACCMTIDEGGRRVGGCFKHRKK
jgi:E3 ubiquitin-protein ligase UBR1